MQSILVGHTAQCVHLYPLRPLSLVCTDWQMSKPPAHMMPSPRRAPSRVGSPVLSWTNDWAAATGAPHLSCFGGQHSSTQVSLAIQVVCHGHFPTVPIGRAETPACHCCSMPLQSTQLTKKHFGGKNSQAGLILYKHLSISEYRPLTYP